MSIEQNKEDFPREGQSTAQLTGTINNPIANKIGKPAPKKKRHGCLTVIIIFFTLGIVGSLFGNDEEKQDKKQTTEVTSSANPGKTEEKEEDTQKNNEEKENTEETKKEPKKETAKETTKKEKNTDAWKKKYKNKDIKLVDMKFLYKNANYYQNKIVMSYGKINDKADERLQFDTNKGNFFKEFTCNFEKQDEISGLKENDNVCFVGKMSEMHSYFGTDTVTINGCYVVATGKEAASYKKKISKEKKNQKQYVTDVKKKQKEKKKKQAQNTKNSYIKKCKTYDYKTIQRKPDKHKGKNIKVSGTVIQVLEGWFGSVGLRLEDSNGDVWYINYSYSDGEDKILEDDNITVYGECTGTETYKTVLGSSVTVPSIDAEYIN